MEYNEFSSNCNNGYCLRKTNVSNNCKKDWKQKKCFSKWSEQKEKKVFNNREENEFVVKVWISSCGEYDGFSKKENWWNYCQIWKILSEDDKNYIISKYEKDLWLNTNLDVAHIYSRAERPDLKDDPDNGVVIGRMFHSLLDQYKHPVTREKISKEERLDWLKRAKGARDES